MGLDFDILNAILHDADIDVNYVELPWERHLAFVKEGRVDLAMGASKNEERLQYAYFTEAYRKEKVVLLVRNGYSNKISLPSISALKGSPYTISIEKGYYYGDVFKELCKDPKFKSHIVEVIDLEQNITMLMDGEIDGLFVDPITIASFVTKYRLEGEFEIHPLKIYESDIHIMLSKKTDNVHTLINKLNVVIEKYRKEGRLETFYQKYSIK